MEIKSVGIVGAGTMGSQIAELFLKHGFEVSIFSKEERINRLRTRLKEKGLLDGLNIAQDIEGLGRCGLIIESVKEDIAIKRELFTKLDRLGPGHILASNTSSIPLKLISEGCRSKSNIVGIHFSNPAILMKLVEIVKTGDVSDETLNTVLDLMKSLGKEPVVVKDNPGFVLNRVLFPMLNEAAQALHEGIASKEEIDKIMVLGASHPAGPLKIIDLVGVDVTVDILKNLQKGLKDDKFSPSPILLEMLKENRLGRKTKKGFYDY